MKIAMLSEGWKPVYGGGQVHVEHLCRGLVEHHHCSVDLFVRALKDSSGKKYDTDESYHKGNWKIIRTGWTSDFFSLFYRFLWLFQVTWVLYWKAKKEKYDLIHAHALLSGLPAKVVSWLTKIPVIYTVHGTMHMDVGKWSFAYFLEKFFVTQLKYDLEISVSKRILSYHNVNKNIHILPNGVDILSFDRVSGVSKHSGIHFLTVARIDWQKNHLMVLDALSTMDYKLLKKQGFHRNIVGDGILKQQLEQRIEELGLSSFVTLKGKLFGETLIREYKKNHIFLLPSLSEGQPLTILEAFASKLPVLCTDVGDNNAFVSSHTGWMIPPGDSSALASVFQKMLKTDVKGFQKMGNHAYSLVQDYDWQRVVEKTYELYKIV